MHEKTFYLLTALAGGPAHGYGLMQQVAELSDARVTVRASTLYDALDRLERDGLIEVDRDELVGRRLRRFYRLSNSGREALAGEVSRMRYDSALAAARLRLSEQGG
jgi:DNA-binding PadR family transcriptional regulator